MRIGRGTPDVREVQVLGDEEPVQAPRGAPPIGIWTAATWDYLNPSIDLAEQRDFPDPIALGGYPIDIHSPEKAETDSIHFARGTTYQIPMRSLLVEAPANLVIGGRCISATHEAMAAFRVTPIAMAIGGGHQAIEDALFDRVKFDAQRGENALTDMKVFPAKCVNPPDGVKTADWIEQGFPGAQCP